MPLHLLTNFEIQKYYQNQPRFNGVYSRDNLPKTKDGDYVINLDEYFDIGTDWIAFYASNDNATNFVIFGVENIPKKIKTFTNKSTILTTIFRIQAYDLTMCRYFCIEFVDFILTGKTLTDFTNLFSLNNFFH